MGEISIPFREDMTAAILAGRKSCTSRNKRYGRLGDTFPLSARTYRLVAVRRLRLGFVARELFKEEGTGSPVEFAALWAEIHPRKGWDPEQLVWTHFFEEVRD